MSQIFRGFYSAPNVDYTLNGRASGLHGIEDSYWYWARKAAPSSAANLNIINMNLWPVTSNYGPDRQRTMLEVRFSEGSADDARGRVYDDTLIMHEGATRYLLRTGLKNIGRGSSTESAPETLIATVEDKTVDLALSHWIGPHDIDLGQVAFNAASPDTQKLLTESWATLYCKVIGHLLDNSRL